MIIKDKIAFLFLIILNIVLMLMQMDVAVLIFRIICKEISNLIDCFKLTSCLKMINMINNKMKMKFCSIIKKALSNKAKRTQKIIIN